MPDVVAVERVFFQVNVRTAMSVGQASGLALCEAAAHLAFDVLTEGAQQPLRYSGKNIRGAIRSLTRLSGTHGRKTPGIFIAAGAGVVPGATDGMINWAVWYGSRLYADPLSQPDFRESLYALSEAGSARRFHPAHPSTSCRR